MKPTLAEQSEPIRLTKHRAQVLLELAERGLEEERREIEQQFDLRFNADGTLSLQEVDFKLIDPGRQEELAYRLIRLTSGVAAIVIFRRRYVL